MCEDWDENRAGSQQNAIRAHGEATLATIEVVESDMIDQRRDHSARPVVINSDPEEKKKTPSQPLDADQTLRNVPRYPVQEERREGKGAC